MASLRILLVGESLVLAGAVEAARNRGHQVVAIFATSAAEIASLQQAGAPVHGPEGDVSAFVAAYDCDVLLSIINRHILDAATLSRPRIAAVNYHNAPLPAYAGLWATTLAVLNGEATHGVTWHVMERGIDTGAILAQQVFALAEDETTATLNVRCTAAALESFGEVLDKLATGDVAGRVQDRSKRTYHGQATTVPHGGVIDWRCSADSILRLVRACDWGPSANPFGRATIATPTGALHVVRSAARAWGNAEPGVVLADDGGVLTVACRDGAVRLVLETAPIGPGAIATSRGPDAGSRATPRAADPKTRAAESVLERIEALALDDPAAPALEGSAGAFSRGELAGCSLAVAAALLEAGLAREDGVGILLPAGADFVVASLGAMRAGGAYVPLDPASPRARILFEIAEAGVGFVLTDCSVEVATDLPGVTVLFIDEARRHSARALPAVARDDCAYRVFTSGSTGRPKAVEITHSALANLAAHYASALPMGCSDRMTMLASPTFDASVGDIWPVLSAGGTLLIPPARMLLDLPGLIAWLARARASCAFVPTAVAERLLDLAWPADTSLRTLLTGGDTLHRRPPAGLPFRLINTYGPTENTVDSLWSVVGPSGDRPPIGHPIAGVTATVVDGAGERVAWGSVGELVLGGEQVARGYRGRPELDAKSFKISPLPPDALSAGRRRYRTGDLVRGGAQGEYEFCGRIDDQLQLLGIRIEPGEIEALLKGDDRVSEAACVPLRAGDEVVGLVGIVVPAARADAGVALADMLQEMLAGLLPPAVVPKRIELRAALPRTASGKIDRRALADAVNLEHAHRHQQPPPAAADPIGELWSGLLPGSRSSSEDTSFWDLGGDSLAAIELLLAVEKRLGVRVPIGLFLADPSLKGLRKAILLRRSPPVVQLSEGKGPPLVLWYGASGDLEDYQHIAPLLAGREVVGVVSPAVNDLTEAAGSLEHAVASALAALRQFGIFEAPALLGYSWSGLLVFEAARQLSEAGTPSPFVGMIGSLPPFRRRGRAARLFDLVRWAPTSAWATLTGRRRMLSPRKAVSRLARLLGEDGDIPAAPANMNRPIDLLHLGMGRSYQPKAGPAIGIHLFRERIGLNWVDHRRSVRYQKPDFGWSEWAGAEVTVHWMDGDHASVMKGESAARLARMLEAELDGVCDQAWKGSDPCLDIG